MPTVYVSRTKHAVWLVAALMASTAGMRATPRISWVATNPGGGGAFNSPVVVANGVWAVGSDLGGVCVSKDAGNSWRVVGASQGLSATHVAAMAANPTKGQVVVGSDEGIYQLETDTLDAKQTHLGGYVSAIAFAANPSVVFAVKHPRWDATKATLLRSGDAGQTWQTAGVLPPDLRVLALRTHPSDSDVLVVVSGEGRFATGPKSAWRSDNGGRTWANIGGGLGDVLDVVYTQDKRLYLSTSSKDGTGRLFRSENEGQTWAPLANRTGVILTDEANPQRLRLANPSQWKAWHTEGVWQTLNGGKDWALLGSSNQYGWGWSRAYENWGFGYSFQGLLQTFANRGETVLSTDSQFIYASSNAGAVFTEQSSQQVAPTAWRSRGCDNLVPETFAPSFANPNLIYVGHHDLGLWRSDNAGKTWISLNEKSHTGGWLGHGGNTLSVLADPVREAVVWAQLGGNKNGKDQDANFDTTVLARSVQRGNPGTWRVADGLPTTARFVGGLSLDRRSNPQRRTVFAVADGVLYRSTDDGLRFAKFHACVCDFSWVFDDTVFAGGGAGLWRAKLADAGTWEPVTKGLPSDKDAWTPNVDFFAGWFKGISDMAQNPKNPKELWLSFAGMGFYRSLDAGTTWVLTRQDPLAQTVALDDSGLVFAGASSARTAGGYNPTSQGLVVGTPKASGGVDWATQNTGLAYPFATKIRTGPSGALWLISPGQGLLKGDWQR